MRNYLASVFTWRGRQSILKSAKRSNKGFKQRYLTASDESALGALTHILKSETY